MCDLTRRDPTRRDPTRRFADRVKNYVRYRPDYPPQVVELLCRECSLGKGSAVADVGSGTGIFSAALLAAGARVFAVEPNEEMRRAAERRLGAEPGFASVAGRAEATGLESASVDLVTAAQAFHWFDVAAVREEWARILRPPRWVALVWNERRTGSTPFLAAYEELLGTFGTDYRQVDHSKKSAAMVAELFGTAGCTERGYPHRQVFDLEGFVGRVLSSSYVPAPGEPRHEELLAALTDLFRRHQEGGRVSFEYDTRVYLGRLG